MSNPPEQREYDASSVVTRRFRDIHFESPSISKLIRYNPLEKQRLVDLRKNLLLSPIDAAQEWADNLCAHLDTLNHLEHMRGLTAVFKAYTVLAEADRMKQKYELYDSVRQAPDIPLELILPMVRSFSVNRSW
ncbi:hypothetical protein AURDEDRAFT_174426 [Auricularia subglabra TFB-10046 SS5]|uniref:Uncharacterized protein n=1 Tax=Auricularia subglabra (strain TFB-10046 / SS5) TaxID=717982 RepID=J0LG74_AURST|nr:hypothetical protein AURDEDRAFT_174426 [Auricularia subglabra TFB-10046 SS5]